MMSNDLPSIIYVDSNKLVDEDIDDMLIDDDDMLDVTDTSSHLPRHAGFTNAAVPTASFQRRAPSHTVSCDSFAAASQSRPSLRREAQASLFPGSSMHSPSRDFSTMCSVSQASGSVPSTHIAVQYMEGMRRLSRSIRQTEMTRTALRRSLRATPSAQSLPPDMLFNPEVNAERQQVFQWAASSTQRS